MFFLLVGVEGCLCAEMFCSTVAVVGTSQWDGQAMRWAGRFCGWLLLLGWGGVYPILMVLRRGWEYACVVTRY